jgi:hypothetical protein
MARVFISYSHRDEKPLTRLHTHLAMLRRAGVIAAWYDREILAGGDIDREVALSLESSDLFFALLSLACTNELFLKSDGFGVQRAQNGERMSAEEAADGLWREFISHAGIDHE